MARYLVQVEPAKIQQVKASLKGINIPVITQAFDYVLIDIPEKVVPKVKALPYVVDVRPEQPVKVFQLPKLLDWLPALPTEGPPIPRFLISRARAELPVGAIPVEKKLARFIELAKNPFTLAQAFAFAAAETIDRWPTGESRKMLGADVAEAEGAQGKGVKVAVIDTGAAPSLQGHYFSLNSKSSVEGQLIPWDENGHGLWCASCISGSPFQTPFGLLKGVAPDCEVEIFKCLGYGIGAGSNTSVLRAMMDAFEWGANIVSMSLGSTECQGGCDVCPNCRAVRMLAEQGVLIVVANGNEGEGTQGCPACSPSAISVGAIDKEGKIASFSSRKGWKADKPNCTAPGVYTTSSSTGLIALMQAGQDFPGTASISGTSMACPHVSGLLALWMQYLKERGITLTPQIAKDIMKRYGQLWTADYGYGVPRYEWVKEYYEEVLSA